MRQSLEYSKRINISIHLDNELPVTCTHVAEYDEKKSALARVFLSFVSTPLEAINLSPIVVTVRFGNFLLPAPEKIARG